MEATSSGSPSTGLNSLEIGAEITAQSSAFNWSCLYNNPLTNNRFTNNRYTRYAAIQYALPFATKLLLGKIDTRQVDENLQMNVDDKFTTLLQTVIPKIEAYLHQSFVKYYEKHENVIASLQANKSMIESLTHFVVGRFVLNITNAAANQDPKLALHRQGIECSPDSS